MLAGDLGGPLLDLTGPGPRRWSRRHGTPGGGDGAPSSAGTPTRRCRCAGCRRPGGGHRLQGAVDGGQADALAAAAQFVVQFLGGAELVEFSSSAEMAPRCRVARTPVPVTRRSSAGVGRRRRPRFGEVVVDEAVQHFPSGPLAGDHPGRLEDPQVLADQRLRYAERVDEFVHAAADSRSCSTIAMRTGAASARSRSPAVSRTSRGGSSGERCDAVLVAVVVRVRRSRAPSKVETVFIMSVTNTCGLRMSIGSRRRSVATLCTRGVHHRHRCEPRQAPWPGLSSPVRSTAARSRRGTTARSAWSSRRTSSGSGGARWSPAATTSSAWTARSSCRARCGSPPVTSRSSTIRWSSA